MHAWCSSWIMNNIHGAKLKITCIFLFLDPLILLIHWLLPIQMSMHGRNADAGGVKKGWGRYGLERWPWIVAKITRHCRQFISSSAAHALLSLLRDQCRHSLPHEKLNATVLTRSHESFCMQATTEHGIKNFLYKKKSYNWICARYWQGNMGVE